MRIWIWENAQYWPFSLHNLIMSSFVCQVFSIVRNCQVKEHKVALTQYKAAYRFHTITPPTKASGSWFICSIKRFSSRLVFSQDDDYDDRPQSLFQLPSLNFPDWQKSSQWTLEVPDGHQRFVNWLSHKRMWIYSNPATANVAIIGSSYMSHVNSSISKMKLWPGWMSRFAASPGYVRLYGCLHKL